MKKILAIDDQRDNLISIKGFLRNFLPDCELFLAQSGKEGIAIAQKEQPDTILLDIIMPEMDGFEVCKILKQDDRTKFIPILILSALGQDHDSRVRGLELGADAFLAKPFIPTELKAQINVMLRIKEAEDLLREEKDSLEDTVIEKSKELIESGEKYELMFENMLNGFAYHKIVTDSNGKPIDYIFREVNKGFEILTGLSRNELIGMRVTEALPGIENDPADWIGTYGKVALTGKEIHFESFSEPLNKWYTVYAYCPQPENFVTIFEDITERKQVEENLKESERKTTTLINNLQGIAYRCKNDKDWTMVFLSAGIKDITGYTSEDIIENKKLSFSDIIIPEDRDRVWRTIQSAIEKRESFEINYRIKTASGELKYLSEKGSGVFASEDGEFLALEGFVNDVTKSKMVAEALKSSEELYKNVFNNSPLGILHFNTKGVITDCNDEFVGILGSTKEKIVGLNMIKQLKDLKIIKAIEDTLSTGSAYFNDYYTSVTGEKTTPVVIHFKAIYNLKDEIIGGVGMVEDITDRKKAEKEIIQSEKRFKRLFDGLGDAVFVTKVGGKDRGQILEVNIAATVQTGFTRDELLKMNIISDLYVEDSGEISFEIWEEKLNKGETVTTIEKKKKKDGSDYWTEMIVTRIEFKGEKASLSINHDITNRKRAELIQRVLYNISNAVIVEDNLEELIEFVRKELGQVIDTNNFYVALYDEKTDTLSLPFILDEVEKRTIIPAGKTLTNYVIKTQKPLLANKKKIKELENSGDVGTFGAESEVWLGVPLKIEGEVTGVLAIQSYTNENAFNESDLEMLEFVTEQISNSIMRKKAEEDLKNALKKATESDRLKSAFLATISHELRTPLNAIIGFSDLINKDWPLDEIISFAKTINESGTHLLSIVEEIFNITLIETGETTITKKDENLHLILNEINQTISNEQRKLNKDSLEINLKIPERDASLIINTDVAKLKQIFINLLKNALKFTHKGYINFGYTLIEQDDKKMLRFYVEDTGIGVANHQQELIFITFRQVEESFARTYGGTGIGLSISKKLVELFGGSIGVESTEGVGSIFYFTIPFEGSEITDIQYDIKFTKEAALVGDIIEEQTFLIVDDDETSFDYLEIALKKPGVNILWAKNGKKAIEYCKERPDITLVLMDINMRVMDGYKATKEIKKFRPQLPIIAQTALALAGDREKTLKAGCDDYISKPINIENLVEKIEKLI